MKKSTHPNYYPNSVVTCACGNTWTTGSTRKTIATEVCSKCHPFFTGQQQRLLDREGQVDRFYKKLQARQSIVEEKRARQESRTSPERTIVDLGLGTRPTDVLATAGITTVGQVMERLANGDDAVLAIDGFGRKSLIDLKKRLRQLGYPVPETTEASA